MTSPKTRFLENKDIAARHKEFVSQPWVQDALHVALAEYVSRLRKEEMYLLEGAKTFIDIFFSLSSPFKTHPQSTSQGLEYDALPRTRE